MYREAELEFALAKSGAKALIMPGSESAQSHINAFDKVLGNLNFKNVPDLTHVLLLDSTKIKTCDSKLNIQSIQSLIDTSRSQIYQPSGAEEPNSDDPAIIMFTSVTLLSF